MTADRPFIDLCYDLARVIPDLVDCVQGITVAVVIVAVAFGIVWQLALQIKCEAGGND